MMKKILFIIVAFLTTGLAYAQEGAMLNDLDLPLLKGLSENNDAAMLFDSPDGRIINAQAAGEISAIQIFEYYKVVLPSLGWRVTEDHMSGLTCEKGAKYCISARREKEGLALNIHENGARSKINYALSPF